MTTTAPHCAGRTRGTVWTAIGALIALAAIVAVPPIGLVLAVGSPIPEHITVAGSLSDDAIIGLLAAVVWAAWAQLVLVIAVEAAAAVRGGVLPRVLPGCGVQQHLARRLVVTASLLLAGSASLSISVAPASAATVAEQAVSTTTERPAATAGTHAAAPCTASAGTPEPPALASPFGPQPRKHQSGELWYEVAPPRGQHHDSLWDIAERHLGDGLRWREIYDLNRLREQPDGQRLEQPRLILPGWRLLMPPDGTGLPATEAAQDKPTEALDRNGSEAAVGRPANTANAEVPPALPRPRAAGPADAAGPTATRPIPPAPTPSVAESSLRDHERQPNIPTAVSEVAASDVATRDDEATVNFGDLTLGLCAVSASGILAELARRRRRAQRFRRPGERLAHPTKEAASAERQLRTANAELTVTVLRDALRRLAGGCRAIGRPLPDVELVTLNAEQATLHLRVQDPVAVHPFLASGPRTWTLDNTKLETGAGDDDDEVVDPYPALVAVGVTQDRVLLVNLEAAGSLAILGDPAQATPILHALIAEVGTSVLCSTAQIALVGCPLHLAQLLDRGRVTLLEPDQVSGWASARADSVATVLAATGVPTVHLARSRGRADDLWAPPVLICGPGVPAVIEPTPHGGLSTVVAGRSSEPVAGWTLSCVGESWRLEPHGIEFVPQRLDAATLAVAGEMLATAERPTELPDFPDVLPVDPPAAAAATSLAHSRSGDVPLNEDAAERPDSAAREPGPATVTDIGEPRHDSCAEEGLTAPRVLVLGPVAILGANEKLAPGRKARATELIAYLALHPGATQHQLDEALSPGIRVSRNTRNSQVSRARQWLGSNPSGHLYLPHVADEGAYSILSEVRTDWDDFRALADRGIAAAEGGIDDLVAALQLVRGRPFLGVTPAAYGWAEVAIQDMISAIVDVAHALAESALSAGEHRLARWAAAKGMEAEPFAELLYQDAIRAARAAGDADDVEHLVNSLRRRLSEMDPEDDLAYETGALATSTGDR